MVDSLKYVQYSSTSEILQILFFFFFSCEGKGPFIHSFKKEHSFYVKNLPGTFINARISKREELQQLLSLNDHKTG